MSLVSPSNSDTLADARAAALDLLEYCRTEGWAGYDPYDGLSSRLTGASLFSRNWVFRLAVTQVLKRSPVNLRPLLGIPKEENPKACALFCRSLIILAGCGLLSDDAVARERLRRLLELRSSGRKEYCWGYNFDWQSRRQLIPKFTPNVICTTFAGNALIDAHEKYGKSEYADAAASAGEFLTQGLNLTHEEGALCFSYSPLDHAQVHNANLLAAAFLGRLAKLTGSEQYLEAAAKAVRFSLKRQSDDGSWPYGEGET